MKQIQVINAFTALNHLRAMRLPVRDAYNVFNLRKQLEQSYIFEMEREKKLLEETDGQIKDDGSLLFPTEEAAIRFNEGVEEANNMDVEIEFEPIQMQMDAIAGIQITPEDIEKLDGFVIFM